MLHLTPDMLERTYELLRTTPPFKGWKLPEADAVGFSVVLGANEHGCTVFDDEKLTFLIKVSSKRHKHLCSVVATMAHEMVHMREWQLKARADVHHGATFNKLADSVCRHHGFDRGQF